MADFQSYDEAPLKNNLLTDDVTITIKNKTITIVTEHRKCKYFLSPPSPKWELLGGAMEAIDNLITRLDNLRKFK